MTTTATAPEPTVDTVEIVPSFIQDSWWTPDAGSAACAAPVLDASTGELLAKVSTEGLDLAAVVDYGRTTGQAELGKLTFHQRALKLKELAQYLNGRRDSSTRSPPRPAPPRSTRWSTSTAASACSSPSAPRAGASSPTLR